jgi:hypothetical protein
MLQRKTARSLFCAYFSSACRWRLTNGQSNNTSHDCAANILTQLQLEGPSARCCLPPHHQLRTIFARCRTCAPEGTAAGGFIFPTRPARYCTACWWPPRRRSTCSGRAWHASVLHASDDATTTVAAASAFALSLLCLSVALSAAKRGAMSIPAHVGHCDCPSEPRRIQAVVRVSCFEPARWSPTTFTSPCS